MNGQSEELENVTEQAYALVDDFEKELDAMWHDVHNMLTGETEEGDFVDIVEELTFLESNQWNYGSTGIEGQEHYSSETTLIPWSKSNSWCSYGSFVSLYNQVQYYW